MAKLPTVTTLSSGYFSTETLNENFTALRDAFELFVSRDGATPNTFLGDLDMNNNDILNVGQLDVATLVVNNVDLETYLGQTSYTEDINGLTLADGDLLYFDGTNINRLPIGTEGQVLKVVSGTPAWAEDLDTDTDTVGVTVDEDGVEVETEVTTINFVTGGAGAVTSPSAGSVTVDLTAI